MRLGGVSGGFFVGFFVFGVCLGAPFFLFIFLFFSGKRGVLGEGILLFPSSFNYSNPKLIISSSILFFIQDPLNK